MIEVRQTAVFSEWLAGLRDVRAKARIVVRIRRMEMGNPGDFATVGEGICEMRIHYGPGYRLYFVPKGDQLVVLLCGGDKQRQAADIARAKAIARDL